MSASRCRGSLLCPSNSRQKGRNTQPPFNPSVGSLCHFCATATRFSYRFPIFETSATALCGTTGNNMETITGRQQKEQLLIPCKAGVWLDQASACREEAATVELKVADHCQEFLAEVQQGKGALAEFLANVAKVLVPSRDGARRQLAEALLRLQKAPRSLANLWKLDSQGSTWRCITSTDNVKWCVHPMGREEPTHDVAIAAGKPTYNWGGPSCCEMLEFSQMLWLKTLGNHDATDRHLYSYT